MLIQLFAVPAAIATVQPAPGIAEAAHAIEAGRLDQARTMINAAVAQGVQGDALDRTLADLAFVKRNYATALPRYEALIMAHPADGRLAERAGISALHLKQVATAIAHLDKAIAVTGASWKAWNARGVAADLQSDWTTADRAYARAAQLAPNAGQVANNLGWSLLMRGQWDAAIEPLERAVSLSPKSRKITDNLELARAAIAAELPSRRPGEDSDSYAARLNDAGVVAQLRGDRKKAVAAFTQALEARNRWFDRAANNLSIAEAKK